MVTVNSAPEGGGFGIVPLTFIELGTFLKIGDLGVPVFRFGLLRVASGLALRMVSNSSKTSENLRRFIGFPSLIKKRF